MTGIAFFLILSGILIFVFSFAINFKKMDISNDFNNIIKEFEKNNSENDFDDKNDLNPQKAEFESQTRYDDFFDEDDADFKTLLSQSKFFVRLIGIVLAIIGAAVYLTYVILI